MKYKMCENTTVNIVVVQGGEHLWSGRATVSFSRRTLLSKLIQAGMRLACCWYLQFSNVDRIQLYCLSGSMALLSSHSKERA